MAAISSSCFAPVQPEKLAVMKLNIHEADKDFFNETNGSNGRSNGAKKRISLGSVNGDSTTRSMVKSGRQASRVSRRSSSFMSSHRSKMSQELTAKAESRFISLMDLMASASREASSLKEFWSQILAERESFAKEREELFEQITECTNEMEMREQETRKHGDEAGERKKQVEKLLLELSIAISNVQAEKKKVVERDNELENVRAELNSLRESSTISRTGHEKVRTEIENIKIMLTAVEAERDCARDEVERNLREIQRVIRERNEHETKLTDITSKFDLSRKEILSLTDRIKMHDLDQEERIHEMDRLREDARKARVRADEAANEVIDHAERNDRTMRENTKLKESLRVSESERDEQTHSIENLRREIKNINLGRDEAEAKVSDISLKYEHIKREVLSLKEKHRDLELEKTEISDTLDRSRESHRMICIERDEMRSEIDAANRRAEEARRHAVVLTDNVKRSEQSLIDLRSEQFSAIERVKHGDSERDGLRTKIGRLHNEVAELKESIVVLQAENRTIKEVRDRYKDELERTRQEYEEITETITTFNNDSHDLEFEIDSLRIMLREAREQKESAITARNLADRERDDAVSKYEEKCREMERFEESAASHYHSSIRSEGLSRSSTSRIVSKASTTGTTVKHESGDSHDYA